MADRMSRTNRRVHVKKKRYAHELIRCRSGLFPQPWTTLSSGDPDNREYIGLPEGTEIEQVSPLTLHQHVDFWSSYTMFLRTTRKRVIDKRCSEWKTQKGKERVSPKAKREFIRNLWPTSLFDTMYRLRIRSNYADVDSFLLSLDMDTEAKDLNLSIRNIGWYSELLFELLTARYIGKKAFREIVQAFVGRETAQLSEGLIASRWEAIEKAWR